MEEKLAVADEADAFAERLAKKAEAAEKFLPAAPPPAFSSS